MLDKTLLDVLACPKCKGTLEYREEKAELRCLACKLVYHVKDDIPIMLIDQATELRD
jgi:uncharacterized protein YbaR (Trm112 family)